MQEHWMVVLCSVGFHLILISQEVVLAGDFQVIVAAQDAGQLVRSAVAHERGQLRLRQLVHLAPRRAQLRMRVPQLVAAKTTCLSFCCCDH